MSLVRNLAPLIALVLLRCLLENIERRDGVDSIRGRSDATAIRILHDHIGSDIKMGSNRRFRRNSNGTRLVVVRIEDHPANGDLIAVVEGVFGGGGGDIDVRINIVHTRAVLRFDFDLRVESMQRTHLDAPWNVLQPLQATVAVF